MQSKIEHSERSAKGKKDNQPFFQPKLTVNQPNDVYEQEADDVADKVMKAPALPVDKSTFFTPAPSLVQKDGPTTTKTTAAPSKDSGATKTLTGGASVVKDALGDKPGFDEFQEHATDALKKKLWDDQPTELKAAVIGSALSTAGTLGGAFAGSPTFRSNTIKTLDGTNLLMPLSLLPYHEYLPLSSFKYKLPSATNAPITFDTEFEVKPYLDFLYKNISYFPKTDLTLGVSSEYSSKGGFGVTGGSIKLKLGGGIVNLQGYIHQPLPVTPTLVSGTDPGESPAWMMRSLPSQADDKLATGSGVFITVDVARLPELWHQDSKPDIHRKCAHCEDEDKLNRKENGSSAPDVTPNVEQTIQSQGQKMDSGTRDFMEQRFGYDFGDVQIHNDSTAHQSSADINALAYTHNNHIAFANGQYQPETDSGKRLLAHELTHVLQQGNSIGRKTIQRKGPPETANKIGFVYTKGNIVEDVKNLKKIAPFTKAIIVQGSTLMIYKIDGDKPIQLKSYHLVSDIVMIPIYHLWGADGRFYPIIHDEKSNDFGIPAKPENLTEEQKKALADVNDMYTIDNWFTDDKNLDDFYNNFKDDKIVGLIVMPYGSGGGGAAPKQPKGEGDEHEEIPPKEKWFDPFEKKMAETIKLTHATEPFSEDLPDLFKFYYSKSKSAWRGYAAQNDKDNKPTNKVYLDVTEGSKPEDVIDNIRQLIRIEKLKTVKDEKPNKDATALASDMLWAYELKLQIEKLMADERKKYSNLYDLPDKISLATIGDDKVNIYLRVDVFNKSTDDSGKEQTQLKSGILPDPLKKGMQADDVLKVVKTATKVLKGGNIKLEGRDTKDFDHVKEAYRSSIKAKDVRKDFESVTGAHHEFSMDVDMETTEDKNTANLVTLHMRTVFYYWDIYRVDDQLTPEEKAALSPDWKERRAQLLKHFKESGQLKTKPLVNAGKLADYNKMLGKVGMDKIDTNLTRQQMEEMKSLGVFYGSKVNIVPDAEISFPEAEGDYLVYCRAQVEPGDNVIIRPSEAFFPIMLEDGYKLAKESTEKPFNEIESVKKQLAEAKTDDEKKKLQDQLDALNKRQGMSLSDRLTSDLADTKSNLNLVNKLKRLYESHPHDTKGLLMAIAGDKQDWSKLLDLYKQLVKLGPENLGDSIDALIENLPLQAKGLEDVQNNLKSFSSDYDHSKPTFTPVVTLISQETGQEYQLITMIAETKDSTDTEREVVLIDVTTHKTQESYTGKGSDPDKNVALQKAIQDAFDNFGKECAYGKGYVQFHVPGANAVGNARSKPGIKKQIIGILETVAAVAGIAALVIGTVATGGGLLVVALGVGSAVIGAGVAGYHIYDRYENHRLEADVDLAMDILNILGPLLVAVNAAAKGAKMASLGLKTAEGITAANNFLKLERGVAIIQKLELVTNFIAINYKTAKDLNEISESKLPPEQKEALETQILLNAAFANLMIAVSVRNEIAAKTPSGEKELNEMIGNAANEEKYRMMLRRDGLIDAEGRWTIPELRESAAKGEAVDATAAAQKPHKGEVNEGTKTTEPVKPGAPAKEGTETHVPDSYEKKREVAMKGHAESPDGQHDVEVYKDGTVGRCSPVAVGEHCPVLQIQFKPVLDERPVLKNKLTDLLKEIGNYGDNVPQAKLTELAQFEQHLRGLETLDATSEAPGGFKIKEVGYFDEVDVPLNKDKTILEYPGGERVWQNDDGTIGHEASIRGSIGRQDFERQKFSGGKTGLSSMKNYERAHSFGQGFGWESPHGIPYAPRYVNQTLQNNGIEQYIRALRDLLPAGQDLVINTRTQNIEGTNRINSIEYDGFVLTAGGEKIEAFNYKIEVTGTRDAPITDAAPIAFDTNPDPAMQQILTNLQSLIPTSKMPAPILTAQHHLGF